MSQEYQETNIVMDIGARIRVLENKYRTMNENLLIINQNMIEEYKKTIAEMKAIDSEMKIVKQDVLNTKDAIKKMVKEMEIFARKDELKVLEKYINLWNPVEFITQEDFDKQIEEKIKGGKIGRKKR
jgi:hypothetical protein